MIERFFLPTLHASRGRARRALLGAGLMEAAKGGKHNWLDDLLHIGADANETGSTALVWAAGIGNTDVVRRLLDSRADVFRGTALVAATAGGHFEIVRLILQFGVNLKKEGVAAARISIESERTDIIQLLLNAGVQISDKNTSNSIHRAIYLGHIGTVQFLLNVGIIKAKPTTKYSGALLVDAAEYGKTEICKMLLVAGVDVNATNYKGRTALMCAANVEIVRRLLFAGADVKAKDNKRNTALTLKAISGRTDIVNLLIDESVDVDARNNEQRTALIGAAQFSHTDTVIALLNAGANVNTRDCCGRTALMWAAHEFDTETVGALLVANADVNLRGKDRRTAINLMIARSMSMPPIDAMRQTCVEIANLLRKYGAKE